LGVVGVYQQDSSPFAAQMGRQLFSVLLAIMVGAVCISLYWAVGRQLTRVEGLRQTVDLMTAGAELRTNSQPYDEIGELGAAVDRFAAAARMQVKQLQTEVRQNRRQVAHLHAIFESLRDGMILQDAEGRVLSMNASARQLLGVGGEAAETLALREWSAQAHQKAQELASGLYALQETAHIQINNRIVMVSVALVESIAEKHMGKVLILRDMTQEAQRGAQRNALVDQLAQNVHLSMTQRAQVLALEASTQPVTAHLNTLQDFAKEIAQDARAMQRMISDYHDLTLLQPNELRQRQHPIPVLDLLTVLAEEWVGTASAANLNLDLALPDGEDWYVLGDEKRLLMALGNLMENAIRYNEGGGRIHLSAQAYDEQSRLVFKIHDQGVGIHPDEMPQLFTRFFRGSPRRRDGQALEVMGQGQGLFFAQKIIQAHGGEIVLASQPQQGTQVSIWLPLSAGEALELPQAAPATQSLWDMPTHAALKAARRE
jgi:PAS domain S-box-containing protein